MTFSLSRTSPFMRSILLLCIAPLNRISSMCCALGNFALNSFQVGPMIGMEAVRD